MSEELGHKIENVYKDKGNVVVELEKPEPELKKEVFRFGPEMAETKKYLNDEEKVVEEPKWKIRLRNILEERREQSVDFSEEELKVHEGDRL